MFILCDILIKEIVMDYGLIIIMFAVLLSTFFAGVFFRKTFLEHHSNYEMVSGKIFISESNSESPEVYLVLDKELNELLKKSLVVFKVVHKR